MVPFGRCILLWRLHRGLSQAALAQKTGIPQPNLSDIERGERDVSLRTLRALAQALDVTPGVLADGIAPKANPEQALSRDQLERIAQAAVEGSRLSDLYEDHLARSLRSVTRDRRAALQGKAAVARKGPGRKGQRAWLALSGTVPSSQLDSLIDRVAEKAQEIK